LRRQPSRAQRDGRRDPANGGAASPGVRPGGSGAGGERNDTGGDDPRTQLGALYGALATGCFYPYRVIDQMTLAEAGEIFHYWEANPPPHLLLQAIARLLGWLPSSRPAPASLADLAAAPPPGLVLAPAATLDLPPATFDLDTLRARNDARADKTKMKSTN
jgi:hypothetical protein